MKVMIMFMHVMYLIGFATKGLCKTLLCLVPCSEEEIKLLQPLYGSYIPSGGVVQICVNNTKYLVCDSGWDYRDSSVICQNLGYSPTGMNQCHYKLSSNFSIYVLCTHVCLFPQELLLCMTSILVHLFTPASLSFVTLPAVELSLVSLNVIMRFLNMATAITIMLEFPVQVTYM